MRIGIMGGTFNPIHNAHLMLAELAREEYKIDKLLFMPSGNPPHKQEEKPVPAEHRGEMCRLAIEDNPDFLYCDYEINKSELSYTANTLEYFKNKYPKDELYFIIGGDSLCALETWYKPEKILAFCTILVFERSGVCESTTAEIARLAEKYGANIKLIHAPKFDISSSQIRERIAGGKTVRYMIPAEIIDYINEHKLYRE